MKKLYLFNCLFLLLCFNAEGQSLINNHWQLGQTDLNFTNINPSANIIPNGKYGTASISDSTGNLLFYTNGDTVWDKNHNTMTNGLNLINGINNAFQIESSPIFNTIIVPNPGNSQQYYIISSCNLPCTGGGSYCDWGTVYVYSIVEFNSNNPNGIVLTNNIGGQGGNLSQYAIELPGFSVGYMANSLDYGPLVVAKANDNVSFWVIIQKGNQINSFKIDSGGLNLTPVVSTFTNAQIYHSGFYNSFGQITGARKADFRMTPNNLKLIGLEQSFTYTGSPNSDPANFKNYFYSLDFNSSTGQFSNHQSLTGYNKMIYEFEISNNSNNLFFVRRKHPTDSNVIDGEIVVKDLTNNSTPVRVLNEYINTTTPTSGFKYIQKDRNGNILISSTISENNRNLYIHKIENQDNFTTSSVNVNFLSLNVSPISMLPQLIPEFVVEPTPCPNLVLTTESQMNFNYVDYFRITTNTSYNVDQLGQNIKMYASDYILLMPNTFIKTGSNYLASIKGCTENNKSIGENSFDDANFETGKKEITFYPNPTNSILNVSSIDSNIKSITVYAIDGKLIYSQNLKGISSYQLNVSGYSNGIYILNIETDNGKRFSEKLVVKN
jgi:hypothetical protein